MKITPQQSGSVIGRDAAIASLHTLLDSNRQVTIIGPPGVGKTHLVEHLARQAGATLLGYASLLDADDEGRLIEVLAHAMGIAAQAAGRGASKDHVLRCLERMQSGLLVIDHAERVKAPLCELIQAVSGRAPDITWLVASQTRMELPYEHVFELPPLTLPTGDTLAEIQASDAVRLLVDKATATRAFEVPIAADTWRVFAQIANQLDGLPLALDLAAQRMRVLSPFEVLEHLSSRFDLLKRQAADGHLSRHQTLETALAWAWEQLPDWAQAALGQCCVFKGGFEYEAAAAVLDLSEFESAPDTLDVLETLLDHSLIRRFEQDHRSRFTLLNSISAFAAKRRPPSTALLRRHARYYGDRGQGAAESTWRRASKERQWLLRNRENLEAVVDEQASHKAYAHSLSAVYALDEILYGTPLSQHLSRIERTLMAVKSEKPTSLSLKIGLYRGRCLRFLGRHQDSLEVLESVAESARTLGLEEIEIWAIADLARTMRALGESERARSLIADAAARAEKNGRGALLATIKSTVGLADFGRGRLEEARGALQASKELALNYGLDQVERIAEVNLGRCHLELGEHDAARACFARSIELSALIGHEWSIGYARFKLAELDGMSGRLEDMMSGFECALDTLRQAGDQLHEAETLVARGNCLTLAGDLDQARTDYVAARRVLGSLKAPRVRVMAHFNEAWTHALNGEHQTAIAAAESGLADAHAIGDPSVSAIAELYCGVFHALAGDLELAGHAVERGETWSRKGMPRSRVTHGLAVAYLDFKAGDDAAALSALVDLRKGGPHFASSDRWYETCVLATLLESELPTEAKRSGLDGDTDLKILGRTFAVKGADWVDLSRKDLLFRLLETLVEAHAERRGEPVQLDALIERLWPDEKISWDAATARVYTAVSTLRRAGLRGIIQRRSGGYLLDEEITIARR